MDIPTTVEARGRTNVILPQPYWHVATRGGLIFHNAVTGDGVCMTISLMNLLPDHEDALTPYSVKVMRDEKEALWEQVRKQVNPAAPGRKGVMFLVESEGLAHKIADTWFAGEGRVVVETRLIAGSVTHRADAKWLDAKKERWTEAAREYWQGEMTADPMPEVLVTGLVYFPGWKSKPFGLFGSGFAAPVD